MIGYTSRQDRAVFPALDYPKNNKEPIHEIRFCHVLYSKSSFHIFSVRLVGSPLAHAGIVQIRNYGRWGSSCDRSWGLTQGHVVCRELGYRRALFTSSMSDGLFERNSAPIWIKGAKCTGNESSIFHCDLKYMCSSDPDYNHCLYDVKHSDEVICESNHEPALNGTYPSIKITILNY